MTSALFGGPRNGQVFIKGSGHVPLPKEAVLDSMETLIKLLKKEDDAGVRAVLGHFVFVFMHPYMDGNGRIGRFLMNVMLASGGFPWTIIRLERRKQYMSTLEEASVNGRIGLFAEFIRDEMNVILRPAKEGFTFPGNIAREPLNSLSRVAYSGDYLKRLSVNLALIFT